MRTDPIFGSNSQLRATAEIYGLGTGYPVPDELNEEFIGYDRAGGQQKWRAMRTDLVASATDLTTTQMLCLSQQGPPAVGLTPPTCYDEGNIQSGVQAMSTNNLFNSGVGRFLEPPVDIDVQSIARLLGQGAQSPFGLPVSSLGQAIGMTTPSTPGLLGLELESLERWRRRREWNDWLEHAEKPASVSEEGTIDRARRNVQDAISDSLWLSGQRVSVEPQGSYHNSTNTRRDADVDLRVRHPLLKIDYDFDVVQEYADQALSYSYPGVQHEPLFAALRQELRATLSTAFGAKNVVVGKKAIRVKGITGSRAEVDVVPTVGYHSVIWSAVLSCYLTLEGVAILSADGRWTLNFPEQHYANGVSKRTRTAHQFKRVVRSFKRLRADMTGRGVLKFPVPSFLVESLVYNVEDGFFTMAGDDRYERIRRVAQRLQLMLHDEPTAATMVEVNGVKQLFTVDQCWSWAGAIAFADAVVAHLGDA